MKNISALALLWMTVVTAVGSLQAQPKVGSKAPDFYCDTIYHGATIERDFSLSSMRGIIVVIDFWATWCAPCVQGFAHLDSLQREFEDVVFIALSEDDSKNLSRFVSRTSHRFRFGRPNTDSVFSSYGVTEISRYIIVNSEGVIAYEGSTLTRRNVEDAIQAKATPITGASTNHASGVSKAQQQHVKTSGGYGPGDDPVHSAATPITGASINHASEVSKAQQQHIKTSGGYGPGDDPVHTAVVSMLGLDPRQTKMNMELLIFRRSFERGPKGLALGYFNETSRVTISGARLVDIFLTTRNLSSDVWISDLTGDTSKYDVVYMRKGKLLQEAYAEIESCVELNLAVHLDSENVEVEVVELIRDRDDAKVVSWPPPADGTENLYMPIKDFVRQIEKKVGMRVLVDESLCTKVVYAPEMNWSALESATPGTIFAFLETRGLHVERRRKPVVIYSILRS